MKLFFLFVMASYVSHAKCVGKEKWIPRIKYESYAAMKARQTQTWLKENKIKIKRRKDLLDGFNWENKGGPKLHSKSYSYKFSIDQNCEIQVAKMTFLQAETLTPDDMNHVLLAGGDRTITAGIFNLYYSNNEPQISITRGSTRFCPNFESLKYVEKKLIKQGWKKENLSLHRVPGAGCPDN